MDAGSVLGRDGDLYPGSHLENVYLFEAEIVSCLEELSPAERNRAVSVARVKYLLANLEAHSSPSRAPSKAGRNFTVA